MLRLTVLATLLLVSAAQAAECSITNARYEHDQAAWWLSFKPVPRISAPNQTTAFIIELPNAQVTLEGAIHRPNGFGSPLWTISGPCSEESTDTCTFVNEGSNPAAYGNYGGKVDWFDDSAGAKAPDQLILPELAVSLWYSMYRGTEFDVDGDVGDVFTLNGCE
jgi:hypothetical protein